MSRSKGISLSLTILVVAIVLLSTAAAMMFLGGNVTSRIGQIVGEGQRDQGQLARQNCEQQRDVICAQQDLEEWAPNDLDQWAEEATYDGRTCRQWQEDEQIYGPDGVPECEMN